MVVGEDQRIGQLRFVLSSTSPWGQHTYSQIEQSQIAKAPEPSHANLNSTSSTVKAHLSADKREGCSLKAAFSVQDCTLQWGKSFQLGHQRERCVLFKLALSPPLTHPVPSGLASVNDQVLRPNCYSCSRRVMGGARSAGGGPFIRSLPTTCLNLWMERCLGSCALCVSTRKFPPKR